MKVREFKTIMVLTITLMDQSSDVVRELAKVQETKLLAVAVLSKWFDHLGAGMCASQSCEGRTLG